MAKRTTDHAFATRTPTTVAGGSDGGGGCRSSLQDAAPRLHKTALPKLYVLPKQVGRSPTCSMHTDAPPPSTLHVTALPASALGARLKAPPRDAFPTNGDDQGVHFGTGRRPNFPTPEEQEEQERLLLTLS